MDVVIRSNVCLSRRAKVYISCSSIVARWIGAVSIEQHNFVQVRGSKPCIVRISFRIALLVQYIRNNSDNSHFLQKSTTYMGMCTNFLRQDNFQSSSKHILIDLFTPQSSLGRAVFVDSFDLYHHRTNKDISDTNLSLQMLAFGFITLPILNSL